MMNVFITLIIAAILLPVPAAFGEIYNYVDKNGVMLFTNVPQEMPSKRSVTVKRSITVNSRNIDSGFYDRIINDKSLKYSVEPSLIKAIITVESNWRKNAVSNKGAMGLMQLMPATAKDMGVINPFDPDENIDGGTRYLRFLFDRFNDLPMVIAAYNAGPGNVTDYGGIPAFPETENYVKKVLSIYEEKPFEDITAKIYKVVLDDGTLLFTNDPSAYNKNKLSRF